MCLRLCISLCIWVGMYVCNKKRMRCWVYSCGSSSVDIYCRHVWKRSLSLNVTPRLLMCFKRAIGAAAMLMRLVERQTVSLATFQTHQILTCPDYVRDSCVAANHRYRSYKWTNQLTHGRHCWFVDVDGNVPLYVISILVELDAVLEYIVAERWDKEGK